MKVCSRCKATKALTEFNKKGAGRFQGHCKACQKEWYAEYYKNSPREKQRLSRKRDRDRANAVALIRQYKSQPCMDCGKTYPYYVMDFDHRDPAMKSFNVADNKNHWSITRLTKEIKKCDVVCSNCHRERTHHWRMV